MRLFLSILILIFLGLATAAHKHECFHNKISDDFQPTLTETLSDNEKHHRSLQYSASRPIKIVIDESNLKVTPEQKELIMEKVLPASTDFLARRLTVLTNGAANKIRTSKCYQAVVPEAHRNDGVDADLVIYVTAKNQPGEKFIAWATACVLDSVTRRPIAGQINFNLNYLSSSPNDFEEMVDVTLHEITHILGFSGGLYGHFIKAFDNYEPLGKSNVYESNVLIRGKPRQILKTGRILETARNYFGCPSMNGVEIENDGGSGSAGAHWERTVLHNELMTASSISDAAYSEFTLSLLHDSGWYKVDFSRAEPMFFGNKAGCDFINKGCKLSGRREWCSTNQPLCSFDYKYKAACRSETFSDGCKYAFGFSNQNCQVASMQKTNSKGETYGPNSKCVMGSIIKTNFFDQSESPLCYNYTCTSDNKIKFFPSDGGEIACSSPNEFVKASAPYKGGIRCPNPADFCKDYYPSCPNQCSSKGYCVQGTCECRAGFSGEDCSTVLLSNTTSSASNSTSSNANNSASDSNGTDIPISSIATDISSTNNLLGSQQTSVDPCKNITCPKQGYCSRGMCLCNQGFVGPNCEPTSCINQCWGNGTCGEGLNCQCRNGYSGNDCSIDLNQVTQKTLCPSERNGRGSCLKNNTCKCFKGFFGQACENAEDGFSGYCPDDCKGRGGVSTFWTKCPGKMGKTIYSCLYEKPVNTTSANLCKNITCPRNGYCSDGKCLCKPGYVGPNCVHWMLDPCKQITCPQNRYCNRGECLCNPGLYGLDCSLTKDPCNNVTCPKNSYCAEGNCTCNTGFYGHDCSSNWMDDPCKTVTCPEYGYCFQGKCFCFQGFEGPNCELSGCVNSCSERGVCSENKTCLCDDGYSGNDCSIINSEITQKSACLYDCYGRGSCGFWNTCECKPGFFGPMCRDAKPGYSGSCPNDCKGRGACVESGLQCPGKLAKIKYSCFV